MKKIIIILIIPLLVACSYSGSSLEFKDSNQKLTDQQILEYYKADFNEEKVMFKKFTIGYHNGTPIKASFPCGDICPGYTTKLITYDIDKGKCTSVKGIIKSVYVVRGIAAMKEQYCFPRIIVKNFPDKFIQE